MRTEKRVLYLLAIALCAVAGMVWLSMRTPENPAPAAEERGPEVSEPSPARLDFEPKPFAQTSPQGITNSAEEEPAFPSLNPRRHSLIWTDENIPDIGPAADKKTWESKLNLKFLKAYEGSYTTEDILSESNGDTTIPLDSGWLLKNSKLPRVRIRIHKDAETGEYEPIGGEAELGGGLGVIYEEDEQTGEQKTLLRLKKSF